MVLQGRTCGTLGQAQQAPGQFAATRRHNEPRNRNMKCLVNVVAEIPATCTILFYPQSTARVFRGDSKLYETVIQKTVGKVHDPRDDLSQTSLF